MLIHFTKQPHHHNSTLAYSISMTKHEYLSVKIYIPDNTVPASMSVDTINFQLLENYTPNGISMTATKKMTCYTFYS